VTPSDKTALDSYLLMLPYTSYGTQSNPQQTHKTNGVKKLKYYKSAINARDVSKYLNHSYTKCCNFCKANGLLINN